MSSTPSNCLPGQPAPQHVALGIPVDHPNPASASPAASSAPPAQPSCQRQSSVYAHSPADLRPSGFWGSCFTCWAAQPFYLIACIKGLLAATLLSPVTCTAFLAISILVWPNDIVFTYRAVSKTKLLGPNLRALALLLLPVPLVLFPFFAAVAGLFAGFGCGFYAPAHLPDGTGMLCCGQVLLHTCSFWLPVSGFADAVKLTWRTVKEFWHFMTHSYFVYLQDLMSYDGEPFDICLLQLLISLTITPFGGILGLVGFAFVLRKLPLVMAKIEYDVFKAYFASRQSCFERCLLFVPWLVALVLTPAGVVVVAALMPVAGFLFGFTAAGITAYQARTLLGMFPAGLSAAYQGVYHTDGGICNLISRGSRTWLPKWEYRDTAPMGPKPVGAANLEQAANKYSSSTDYVYSCGTETSGAGQATPKEKCGDHVLGNPVKDATTNDSSVADTRDVEAECEADSGGKLEVQHASAALQPYSDGACRTEAADVNNGGGAFVSIVVAEGDAGGTPDAVLQSSRAGTATLQSNAVAVAPDKAEPGPSA